LFIVERVELDLDDVIAADVLPAAHVRTDLLRLIVEGHEDGVQSALVVTEIDLGALGRRRAVFGDRLYEVLHHRQLVNEVVRGLHPQEIIEHRWSVQPLDHDLGSGCDSRRPGRIESTTEQEEKDNQKRDRGLESSRHDVSTG